MYITEYIYIYYKSIITVQVSKYRLSAYILYIQHNLTTILINLYLLFVINPFLLFIYHYSLLVVAIDLTYKTTKLKK